LLKADGQYLGEVSTICQRGAAHRNILPAPRPAITAASPHDIETDLENGKIFTLPEGKVKDRLLSRIGEVVQDQGNPDARPANTGLAETDVGIDGNPLEQVLPYASR